MVYTSVEHLVESVTVFVPLKIPLTHLLYDLIAALCKKVRKAQPHPSPESTQEFGPSVCSTLRESLQAQMILMDKLLKSAALQGV